MDKTLRKLINKHGADVIHKWIDDCVQQDQDEAKLTDILATHESAKAWFEKFCDSKGFTSGDVYDQCEEQMEPDYNKYGKSCLTINNWRSNGPYVYLWLNKDCQPHFEMGSSIYDMWSVGQGYSTVMTQIEKIIKLRQEA